MKLLKSTLALLLAVASTTQARADIFITGKVISTGGHENPACRQVFVRRNDNGEVVSLRIPNSTGETSISAITITALTTGLNVQVDYDPAFTTGCGPEPKLIYINILSAN